MSTIAPARVFAAWTLLALAGCASTRHESRPEVIPQPRVTTAERAKRYRPAERSVQEIRSRNATVAPPLDFSQRLDQAHDRIYTWGQGLVEATDHRFAAKDKALMPVPVAPFRFGATLESIDRRNGAEMGLSVNLDVVLKLPNIENRLRVFITSDRVDEAPRNARENGGLRAGVRYPLLRYFDFDIGVKLDVPPVAFASVKWAREYQLGDWDFYPFVKLFAETEESVGYATAATFDRWSGRHLLRSSTYAKWRADRDKTEWSQSFIYAHASELIVPERYGSYLKANDIGRGWGLHLLASGAQTNGVTYYEAGVFYARPSSNHWLFWSVEPLVRWDKQYNWRGDAGVRLGVNVLFWDLARAGR
jgi:hypothetical protein